MYTNKYIHLAVAKCLFNPPYRFPLCIYLLVYYFHIKYTRHNFPYILHTNFSHFSVNTIFKKKLS